MMVIILLSVLISHANQQPAPKPYQSHSFDLFGNQIANDFPTHYEAARQNFRGFCNEAANKLQATCAAYPIPNRIGADLTIDHVYIPVKNSNKLMVITSGIHGSEAYAGHMVQTHLLKEILAKPEDYPINFLIIHGVNPFGFKYFRRTNENNVDLNRNFATPEEFKSENKSYKKLRKLLLPSGPAMASWISQGRFYFSTLLHVIFGGKKLILHGLSGQYQDPAGLFYGGNTLQNETSYVQYLIKRYSAWPNSIYHVDLHTGFGVNSQLHLIAPHALSNKPGYYRKLFDEKQVVTGNDSDFYPTTGDITTWMLKTFPDKNVYPITFEMGTMDSQTTMGGMKSLWIMATENQAYWRGYSKKQAEIIGRGNFEDLFNPQNNKWQKAYIKLNTESLSQSLTNFKKM